MKRMISIILVLIVLLAAGCGTVPAMQTTLPVDQASQEPEPTSTPAASEASPEPSKSPEITATPTPEPSKSPEPSVTPFEMPKNSPEPPKVSESVSSPSEPPEATPEASKNPAPTSTPAATQKTNPTPSATPKPTPTPTPTPAASVTPAPDLTLTDAQRSQIYTELKAYHTNPNSGHDTSFTSYEDYIAQYGTSEPEAFAEITTVFMKTHYNVDYRSLDGFIDNLRYYFMPGTGQAWYYPSDGVFYNTKEYLQHHYDLILKNKVSSKAFFVTDPTLFYQPSSDSRIRGRLFINYQSATKDYLNYIQKNNVIWSYDNSKSAWNGGLCTDMTLTTGKWFYVDVEIRLGQFFSQNPDGWKHSEYTYSNTVYLSNYKEWGQK